MASDKRNPRNDIKNGSSYCSSATLILFVALCLVGVWMMTSAAVVPVEFNVVRTDKSENKDQNVGSNSDSNSNPSEGILGNKPENFEEKPVEKVKGEPNWNKDTEFIDSNRNNGNSETFNEGDKISKFEKTSGDQGSENTQKEKDQNEKENPAEMSEEKTFVEKINNEDTEKYESIKEKDQNEKENLPNVAQTELLKETGTNTSTTWSTQYSESKTENEIQANNSNSNHDKKLSKKFSFSWKLCNVTAGPDYIPCLDNVNAIKKLRSTKHYEHRERHCPDVGPTCLVPLPNGYKSPIKWPKSRDKIWYNNVPHTKLVQYKGHQNWVKESGEYLTFPGGGTQFKHGALHYIDFIQQSLSEIEWGKRTRVILDVGCGVASFGGYLFDRDVLTMSFAPKDEHEAQVQFALERGIPAVSAVMGTKRLPFPGAVFDAVHCARCRVPWHIEGGKLLLELNRLLRPGGYFIWSATPVYQKLAEDVEIWKAMSALTKAMCWKLVKKTKDRVNGVSIAIFKKPTDNNCYEKRAESDPAMCQQSDDPDASWNVPLQACMHKVRMGFRARGTQWPQDWPQRQVAAPYWLKESQIGVYGKPAAEDFKSDYEHWKRVVKDSYLNGLGVDWSAVRNVMDMRAVYGGFAAALKETKLQLWVMSIVTIDSPDTLPIIYERGHFGLYHDWCESFSTYPRSYDLLHADHLFSKLKSRCGLVPVIAEADRILRPEGKLIVRDRAETISELEEIVKTLNWEVRMSYSKDNEGLLCVQKTAWRPTDYDANI
ncbi:hypothetical protein LUZ60_015971 [Juncus effusus]|nr:hypothetical protein LUZ60_015971 [Juncus effusus]